MAAVESRKLVSAAPPPEHPTAPEPLDSTREREHKAEQHLDTGLDNSTFNNGTHEMLAG